MLQIVHSVRIGGYSKVPPNNLTFGYVRTIKVSLFGMIDHIDTIPDFHEWCRDILLL